MSYRLSIRDPAARFRARVRAGSSLWGAVVQLEGDGGDPVEGDARGPQAPEEDARAAAAGAAGARGTGPTARENDALRDAAAKLSGDARRRRARRDRRRKARRAGGRSGCRRATSPQLRDALAAEAAAARGPRAGVATARRRRADARPPWPPSRRSCAPSTRASRSGRSTAAGWETVVVGIAAGLRARREESCAGRGRPDRRAPARLAQAREGPLVPPPPAEAGLAGGGRRGVRPRRRTCSPSSSATTTTSPSCARGWRAGLTARRSTSTLLLALVEERRGALQARGAPGRGAPLRGEAEGVRAARQRLGSRPPSPKPAPRWG